MFILVVTLEFSIWNGTREWNSHIGRLRVLVQIARLHGLNLYLQIYL